VQKHNEDVFSNTSSPTFIFKVMDIDHPSCPPSYKLSNYLIQTTTLQCTICIKKRLKLNDVLVIMQNLIILLNGVDDIFKTSKNNNEKNHNIDNNSKF
jgi:hypothetical protein